MQLPIQQSTVTTVPFHGTNLFVVEHEGQPYAPMRPIVECMGLDWKSQHVKLQSGRFETCVVEITTQLPGREIGVDPATYHRSAADMPDSFLASLPYRGQSRKLLMVPIQYWEAKLGRTRLRRQALAQLGGLLPEVRSGLFASVH